MTPLTIAYITARENPRFEWFVSSLKREIREMPDVDHSGLEVIIIDGKRRTSAPIIGGDFDHTSVRVISTHPKPTPWQGEYRQTSKDYFAAANARNTALALARNSHVAFVDDLSVLLPGWLKAHYYAADNKRVLAGTICKNKDIVVAHDGEILSFVEYLPGRDSRLRLITAADEWQRCSGQWLYGGTFSVPLELALAVNGLDEINDSIGGEDYDFGLRLERAGGEIWICKTCGTFEDEDAHHTGDHMLRLDKLWPKEDGPYSSNHLLNQLLRDGSIVRARGNDFDLRQLREDVKNGKGFPKPAPGIKHWVDGQLLSDM